ncbi:MAG TPA: acyl-CoA dehydrogenase, partial [Polyangiaceae bacterium LLY-WYZ-15_(1-7)]|nr:acyl-CoA dehydrogenase [Polyangiaceae bacterium LLY-WYZ-15_(1-7)]
LLRDVLQAERLTALPHFADHGPETFELYLSACRQLARGALASSYRPLDLEPPVFEGGRVRLHPRFGPLFTQLRELGVIAATRPEEVGGQQMPLTVSTLAHTYLMAGNLSVAALAWLTTGAAHLVEAFGDDAVKERFLARMYAGEWTGTMALTEPHAGSSLGDLTTSATPAPDGTYRIRGAKIFISGGDHDVAENVVHLTLARIEGAPEGTKGISLFAVPRLREEGGALVDNDVHVTGVIHKIGWKALPSLALGFGDRGDCHGWLVGAPHQGLRMMFQMMNEARISVGATAAATASAAYHEARAYALERRQGRALGERGGEPVRLVEHPDVRRMLLRQKAIVDGSLALAATTALHADLAEHGPEDARERHRLLLDLLTPITKTFPSEAGFEATALAVQVLGGYGYTSEYLPEAFLRDQKLNTIHEGTTGIQSLDLLGRKVMARGGAGLRVLAEEIQRALAEAEAAGLEEGLRAPLGAALGQLGALTATLGQRGMAGDTLGMLGHSVDYLTASGLLVIGWQHLRLATAATRRLEGGADAFAEGLLRGARYWMATEVPRVAHLCRLCETGEPSYLEMQPEWF